MANTNETTANRPLTLRSVTGSSGGLARRAVLARLADIDKGEIVLREGNDTRTFGHAGAEFPVRVTLQVIDPSLYRDIALNGSIGAAESYMEGKWTVSDLTELVRIFTANPTVLEDMDNGLVRLAMQLFKLSHLVRRNSRSQSRRNIHAHYDLGNDLFELFLDPTLSYSSAVYPSHDSTLAEAAVHKLDLVCRKLQLNADDHLLEIGTGWGGLAMHAARHYGCKVTSTTISQRQFELAQQRVQAAGLQDRVTLLKQDYRELRGQYDKLVSIEMIEAVGHQYLDTYMGVCSQRLKPDGRALFQAILMTDRNFNNYRGSVDFIQKYIFPGGSLPSMSSIMTSVHKATDLQFADFHDISMDYARTLRDWRTQFMARLREIRNLGYPDEFIRMWEFYLCYCEGGFKERAIATAQIVFDKPGCRLDCSY